MKLGKLENCYNYNIIYADPPWPYRNPQDADPARGGKTYRTLTLEQIKSLDVPSISSTDSVLFLWATMPKLREAFEVIDAWGFKYTTCAFVWVKLNPSGELLKGGKGGKDILLRKGIYSGLGYWVNGNAELCLLGKRGHPARKARNVKQIVLAPRGSHSAKPPEVRDRIVRLMGDLPRIELFARELTPGWDVFGDEVPSSIRIGGL